ncbi:lysophospholipid acyltransferase 6-like [Daktulosphaira vitifoliae]|uniref:lysophospholipid acyltransferase 6-like n=1 Tax=Daktulosphaira vitifoliae TaxID=58002 RepID=UPI0021AA26EF|nr:lysophospholipid acyltransferase 6-like [Daktulosphaira vitifoliae]
MKPSSYHGSDIFLPLSVTVGLSVDLVNFVVCQLTALCIAPIMYIYLPPKNQYYIILREIFGLLIGLNMAYICFGYQMFHLILLPSICYIVIITQNPNMIHKVVLLVCCLYLSLLHIYRQIYEYGSYTLDITGPIMVMVQKITALASGLHDGLVFGKKEQTDLQKRYMIRKTPLPLNYISYLLSFQTILAGPNAFFGDYMDFLKGTNFPEKLPKQAKSAPSPLLSVLKKLFYTFLCSLVIYFIVPMYPASTLTSETFLIETPLYSKIWFIFVITTLTRFKYYFAWTLADAVCNASGFGFSGYDDNGDQQWNLLDNIDIKGVEFGVNFRATIDAWNKGTNLWLRYVMYERASPKYNTVLTYTLSAFWHGFYPGYYVTFLTGALFTNSARMARRCFWHRFQKSIPIKLAYDAVTILITRLSLAYMTFPFILLELMPALRVYWYLKFYLHIMALFAVYALPFMVPPLKTIRKKEQ